MKVKNHMPIGRLIAKIDNDFNISESDWVPRVAAWVIDALSQMNCLPSEKKRRELEVSDNVAQFPCTLDSYEIKIFDKNGVEIPAYNSERDCKCNHPSTGEPIDEIAIIDDTNKTGINFMKVADVINKGNRYFILDGNNIELNFDTDKIFVESYEVATYHDDYYDCDCPYIIDDGLLLEALAYYCLFKYLSRGSHHQVFDLKSNSPVTNPWIQWNTLRPKAKISAQKAMSANSNDGWNNFFYNSTFLPRN